MDRSWSVIRNTNEPDPKQARVAAQIKLALLGLVQDYLLEQQIADRLVELASVFAGTGQVRSRSVGNAVGLESTDHGADHRAIGHTLTGCRDAPFRGHLRQGAESIRARLRGG